MSRLLSVKDYQEEAYKCLPRNFYEFYCHGASNEETLEENSAALRRWRIKPRVMFDVTNRNSSTKLFGAEISAPIGISPTAFHEFCNVEAECATARGASLANLPYTHSFHACRTMDQVTKAAPSGVHFFQFYPMLDRELTVDFFRRAENAGYKGLVLTVDFAVYGVKYYAIKTKVKPPHIIAPYSDPLEIGDLPHGDTLNFVDASVTWKYVRWIKSVTRLPLILKGIMSEKDAALAVEAGADAIWVSNHGGRQLDGSLSTIEVLPDIVKAVRKRCPIFIDCGFRSGSDIFKALALGADMVFLGRPIVWALACEGEKGVEKVLNLMKWELNAAMSLTGCSNLSDIKEEMVVKACCSSSL